MSERPALGFWAVAARQRDDVAVIDRDERATTYGELLDRINAINNGLLAEGVERGAVIAVIVPNDRNYIEWHLVCQQGGYYFTPVNWHATGREIEDVLSDCGAAVVVAAAQFAGAVMDAADQVGIPMSRRFVTDAGGANGVDALDVDAWLAGHPSSTPPVRSLGARMLYTSGTSGKPKGIKHPLIDAPPEAVVPASVGFGRAFGLEPSNGLNLTVGPLYHAGPSVYLDATLHLGHCQVLVEKFDPEQLLRLIERHRVTSVYVVPTMFHRLRRLPEDVRARYDVTSLQMVAHAAAPCPIELKQAMMAWWGPVIWESYGGSEGAATIADPEMWLAHPGTVGRPIRGVTVTIVDDDGEPCPAGKAGMVYIDTGKRRFRYHNDPDQTDSVYRGTAFTLGDVGYLDEDGHLFLVDRKKDMIISGGVNIFPAEIEQVLLGHPDVADVVVVGTPNEEWGEEVRAIVELEPGRTPTEALAEELRAHCRERLARYKVPRIVEFRPSLERTPSGKIARRLIRHGYWVTAGRNV